jgi:hypothetical protein
MKRSIGLVLILCGLSLAVMAQTESQAQTEPATSDPTDKLEVLSGALDPSAIRFVPPVPPEPLPPIPIEKAVAVHLPTHTITVVRGAPSTLPDLPPAPEPTEPTDQPAFEFERAAPHYLLGLSVTVYDGALSHLRWQDPETKEHLEAWCGWDWGLVSPMQEVSSDSITYSVFCSPFRIDTTRLGPLAVQRLVPEHPDVAPGEFVFTNGPSDAKAGSGFLKAVRDYCVENRAELEAMQAAREQYRADSDAWKAANPDLPRDQTIILRPHRGSRYLKPAVEGGDR